MKAFIAIFFVCLGFSQPVAADVINGKVVGIVDGDSIDVLDASGKQHRIRLAGIDAPEKSQAFGSRSKENLSTMIFGKTVSVQWSKKDRDERAIGKVLMAGQDTSTANGGLELQL